MGQEMSVRLSVPLLLLSSCKILDLKRYSNINMSPGDKNCDQRHVITSEGVIQAWSIGFWALTGIFMKRSAGVCR